MINPNPVASYLSSLPTPTSSPLIEEWLIRSAQAPDTLYIRAVSRLILVAAVRRARSPGTAFDVLPILISPPGTGKSSALRILAIKDEWYTDEFSFSDPPREMIQHILGRWIIDVNPPTKSRFEIEKMNITIARRAIRARRPYMRDVEEFPAKYLFVGTTTPDLPLPPDNRRLWPIPITHFDLPWLVQNRDQLWAEAALIEATGVPHWFDPLIVA